MKFNKLPLVSLLGLAAALSAGTAHATITTYTDQATFLSLLQPGYFEDTFFDVTYAGIQGASATRTGGGFSVTYTAPTNGLWSVTGAMSTNYHLDDLVVILGSNIYAVGGYFYLTDLDGDFQPFAGNSVSAFASNGIDPDATLSVTANSATNFFGWISTTPILTVTEISGGESPLRWNTLDDFIVGAAVPEPGTLALLALGGAGLFRRRHKLAA